MESDMGNSERIHIQVQDKFSGNWRTYHTTYNESQRIIKEMQTIKDRMPDNRVRAVDNNGRLIDMLG